MTSANHQDPVLQSLVNAIQSRQRVLYIASHPQWVQRRRQEVLQQTDGWVGVQWLTLPQFVDKLLQANGLPYVRITQAIREEIADSEARHLAAWNRIPHLSQGLQHLGMSKSLALWLEDLSKDKAPGWEQALASAQEPVLRELHQLATVYFSWTNDPQVPYKESGQLYRMAAKLVRDSERPTWWGEQVIMEGRFDRTEAERGLLDTLRSCEEHLVWDEPQPDDESDQAGQKVRWYQVSSIREEIQGVWDEVTEFLSQPQSQSSIAIVVPNENYRKKVERELTSRLGFQTKREIPLIHNQLIQKVMHLTELKQSNGSREVLLQTAALFAPMFGVPMSVVAWGRDMLRKSGIREGLDQVQAFFRAEGARAYRRLQHVGEEVDEQATFRLKAARYWERLVNKLRRDVELISATSTWSGYAQLVLNWLDRPAWCPDFKQVRDVEARECFRHLLRVRAEIGRAWEGGRTDEQIPFSQFQQWLQTRVTTACLQTEADEGGVSPVPVWLPEEVYGARVDQLYVMGLAEEVFPAAYAPHWIWDMVQREPDLLEAALVGRAHHEREQRQLFADVIRAGKGEIVGFAPRLVGKGQPVSPSRFLLERIGPPQWREVSVSLLAPLSKRRLASVSQVPDLWSAEQMMHVTGLDLYRRCPFRFFAERSLQVATRLERQHGMTALDRGVLLHQVLKKTFEGEPDSVATTLERAQTYLAEALAEFEARWHMKGSIWHSQKAALQREFVPFVQREAQRVIGRVEHTLTEWGFGVVHEGKVSERSTEEPLILQKGAMSVDLCGIVDRVDVSGSEFSVIDYKLSTAASSREMWEGEDWQIALYLLAFQRSTAEETQPNAGRYAVFKEAGSGGEIVFDGGGHDFQDFAGRLVDQVMDLIVDVKQGRVAPQPRKASECLHCPLQATCRYQEIRQGGA
ncbi:MAG TPA: PD-(D/E)XK nuclease family protein [Bacilli bacterium]|nr:PD-(D/E)XK nuclease family protein [Bacilli bacterium]